MSSLFLSFTDRTAPYGKPSLCSTGPGNRTGYLGLLDLTKQNSAATLTCYYDTTYGVVNINILLYIRIV